MKPLFLPPRKKKRNLNMGNMIPQRKPMLLRWSCVILWWLCKIFLSSSSDSSPWLKWRDHLAVSGHRWYRHCLTEPKFNLNKQVVCLTWNWISTWRLQAARNHHVEQRSMIEQRNYKAWISNWCVHPNVKTIKALMIVFLQEATAEPSSLDHTGRGIWLISTAEWDLSENL